MKNKKISMEGIYRVFIGGVTLIQILFILFIINFKSISPVMSSVVLSMVLILWSFILVSRIRRLNTDFVEKISEIIDDMIRDKKEMVFISDEETIFSKVEYKLNRLYEILHEGKKSLAKDRRKLQSLISDISHQVKTPSTNLKIAISLFKDKRVDEKSKGEYIETIENQIEKIDFLMNALVKTSRLEMGIIKLNKEEESIYETIALSLGNIYLSAKEKNLLIRVDCSEDLILVHDKKWTSEAIFNILDNAVKYTPENGEISIKVEKWEQYTKIDIMDSGRGISEIAQGKIFQRFYRDPDVYNIDGVGIGLYLSREIISKQGGYIKVKSKKNEGSVFSIFLANNA